MTGTAQPVLRGRSLERARQGLNPSYSLRSTEFLLPHPRQHQRKNPQAATDQSHHRLGLREYAGLNEDLARHGKAGGGQQQAGATDEDRQIAYRRCDGLCG